MDVQEVEGLRNEIALRLSEQDVFSNAELRALPDIPDAEEVNGMSLAGALWTMLRLDATRTWRVAALRRRYMGPLKTLLSLGGLAPARSPKPRTHREPGRAANRASH